MKCTHTTMASRPVSAVLIFCVIFLSQEWLAAAQFGTITNVLFDYIQQMTGGQSSSGSGSPVSAPATPTVPPTPAPPASTINPISAPSTTVNPGVVAPNTVTTSATAAIADMLASAIGGTSSSALTYPINISSPVQASPSASSGSNSDISVLASMLTQALAGTSGSGSKGTQSANSSAPNTLMDYYKQVINNANSPPAATSGPVAAISGPVAATSGPVAVQQSTAGPAVAPTQGPKALSFVPPEWNLPPVQPPQDNYYASSQGWSQPIQAQSPASYDPYNSAPTQQSQSPPAQKPHPMSNLMFMPSVRQMINQQANQFGDLAYYTSYGCIDPTPVPAMGPVIPTRTLWYGCESPISKAVCTTAGQGAGGPQSSSVPLMMSLMNPDWTRTMEKCLTPKLLDQMMLGGMSGGTSAMNPMMMMAMGMGSGGGGGMLSMLPALMNTMQNRNNNNLYSQQQQQQQQHQPSTVGSDPVASGKSPYSDPAGANTILSGASQIPTSTFGPTLHNPTSGVEGVRVPGGVFASPEPDCSSIMPMVMSQVLAAGEGINSPEAQEALIDMRKQYLPYSCQEFRLTYTGLPLRLCCPGRVGPPSMMDLFSAKSGSGAA